MKLATLKDGTRDGQLAVVARDLKTAHLADGIAPTLQCALDDWAFIAPQLEALSQLLNAGRGQRSFDFDPQHCMAPLPRAYQWVEGGAYLSHTQRMQQTAGADLRDFSEPLMRQANSDDIQGPMDDLTLAHEQWGIDFEAGLALISGAVAAGSLPEQVPLQIKLLMLVNSVSLRNLIGDEQAKGCGLLQSKAAPSCSPVAVTPDELGEAWKGGKVHLPLRSAWNGKLFGQPQAGSDMSFHFPHLLAHVAKTRRVSAGSIVGSGPVSNQDARRGFACIAEQRARELLADGVASTPFMLFGDTIRIEMLGADGKSIFGAIEQTVKQAVAGKAREK